MSQHDHPRDDATRAENADTTDIRDAAEVEAGELEAGDETTVIEETGETTGAEGAARHDTTLMEATSESTSSRPETTWHENAPRDPAFAPVPARTESVGSPQDAGSTGSATGSAAGHTPVRPTNPAPVAGAPASGAAGAPVPAPAPEYKSGPAPLTSVVGLLGVLTAVAVLITQATDLDIRWDVVGPVVAVGAGALLVVLGLAGLRGQRFRG